MFLPDRYIKGECPVCHAKDQYGDNCEVCSSVYAPTELINPYSTLTGATPELRSSEHFFFKLSDPKVRRLPQGLDAGRQAAARDGEEGQRVVRGRAWRDWDICARGALLRHRDPRCAGQVLLRLARCARRLPRQPEEPFRQGPGREALARAVAHLAELRRVRGRPGGGAGALHRQGHRLLPHAVLAGDAAVQRPQDARARSTCTASSRSRARR